MTVERVSRAYWALVVLPLVALSVFYIYPLSKVLWLSVTVPKPGFGNFMLLATSEGHIAYIRATSEETLFCAFNLGVEPVRIGLPDGEWLALEDSGFVGRIADATAELPPFQALFARRL